MKARLAAIENKHKVIDEKDSASPVCGERRTRPTRRGTPRATTTADAETERRYELIQTAAVEKQPAVRGTSPNHDLKLV